MFLFNLCSNGESDSEVWNEISLAENITYKMFGYRDMETAEKQQEIIDAISEKIADDEVAILFSNHSMDKAIEEFLMNLPKTALLLPIGTDAIRMNNGTVPLAAIMELNRYFVYGGRENIIGAVCYIRQNVFMDKTAGEVPLPVEKAFDGIYALDRDKVYSSLTEFLSAEKNKYDSYVGILSHRSAWIKGNLQVEKALAEKLHQAGIGVIPVFSYGNSGETIKSYDFCGIIENYFSLNKKLYIDALVNFQMHLIRAKDGLNVSEQSVLEYSKLDIPIFHPIDSYYLTEEKWREYDNPLAFGMQSGMTNPEMAGMIEPIIIGLRDEKTKNPLPIPERIDCFVKRVSHWISLRKKKNRDKKIAIILHNSVCSGVEATVGKAFGLDAFESVVQILNRLKDEGYQIQNIPQNGEALRQMIMEHKAYSDFRWTSVEDIAASGGCLYKMSCKNEYRSYYNELPKYLQTQMENSWGNPPGEGMVIDDDIIITGLQFGNIAVMVQPKRGCYGAKCTGEVCRILHDPNCPPAHQYIATYRYIEHVMCADACIHTGTDGSLEYLPGKSNALSALCWPNAVLGALPNLYLYHIGVISEGLVAKRRANAVIVGYLPPSSSGLDESSNRLLEKIAAYLEAVDFENGQEIIIKEELEMLIKTLPEAEKALQREDNFLEGITMLRASALQAAEARKITKSHIFGAIPDYEECLNYIAELWIADNVISRNEEESFWNYNKRVKQLISDALLNDDQDNPLVQDAQDIYSMLQQCTQEMKNLLHGLSGGYIASGESGMPDENGRKILPTGRNIYSMNMDKIPTQTAYKRGIILAEQLLALYQHDEGKYPEKIAMNMISVDIARTHGEQLSQFLYLLGVTPEWDKLGRVIKLSAIPTEKLERPRMDVTLRISGVMRDTWPDAVNMLDEAVLIVSLLEESDEENFVRKNIKKMEHKYSDLSNRDKTIRIFGDPPGAYGAGVDLALKASAWKDEKDLARYFIQSSAFAYGKDLQGKKSIREFIENAKNVDVTCDVTSSRRMDTLACGFGVQVQGGYRLIAKTIGKKEIRQYQSSNELSQNVKTETLSDCIQNDISGTLLNVFWREATMKKEYKGASEIMHRIQTVFDAQCTCECVSDKLLDKLAEAYVNDEQMREWLLRHNRFAAEEIARRLLELQTREKWKPDDNVLAKLQENYLSIEGDMEGNLEGLGEIQGGNVEIISDEKIENWGKNLREIDDILRQYE